MITYGNSQSGYLRCFLLSILVFLFSSIPARADTPAQVINNIEQPTDSIIELISADSVHNSMVTAIATFHSPASIESVLEFYRRIWSKKRQSKDVPGYVESTLPGWHLISRLLMNNSIVLQINEYPQGGTYGFISVTRFDQQMPSISHAVFSGLTPLSTYRSKDGVDTSLMRVYGSNASVSATHLLYRRRLLDKGWQLLLDTQVKSSRVMMLSRGTSRLELTFVDIPEFASAVVVHQVTSG